VCRRSPLRPALGTVDVQVADRDDDVEQYGRLRQADDQSLDPQGQVMSLEDADLHNQAIPERVPQYAGGDNADHRLHFPPFDDLPSGLAASQAADQEDGLVGRAGGKDQPIRDKERRHGFTSLDVVG